MHFALLTLLTSAAIAKDNALKCEWRGDAVDPFTGKDTRSLEISYHFDHEFTFRPMLGGAISVEIKIVHSGLTNKIIDRPLLILLADGSIFEVPVQPLGDPVIGTTIMTHSAVGTIPVESAKHLLEVGVATVRFPDPLGDWTHQLNKGEARRFAHVLRCSLGE